MRKVLTFALAVMLVMAMAVPAFAVSSPVAPVASATKTAALPVVAETLPEGVMTHAEFDAAALDTEVTVHTYVQAVESWWDGACHIYAQSKDGGYYIYGYECTEEEAAKLVPGTKIEVKGYKAEWSGEVEIVDAQITIL